MCDPRSRNWKLAIIEIVLIGALTFNGMRTLPAAPPKDSSVHETSRTRKRVVIVTGEDYKGHHWQETTPVLRKQIAKDRRLAVDVVEDLTFLRTPELNQYDVVVMHFKNYNPEVPGAEGYQHLTQFVKAGGGLVLVHFACGAFQEFKESFTKMAGRVWNPKRRAHDPRGPFQVEIVDRNHPITHGLSAFETTDELYTCLDGATPIHVLAEATSKVDGKRYPMAFVLQYGKGRVFHCPLGHNVAALSNPNVGTLYRRACAWAATLEPVSVTVEQPEK